MKESLMEICGKFLGSRSQFGENLEGSKGNGQLEKYRKLMESGEYVQMCFEKAEGDGTLSRVEDGVVICMAPEELSGKAYDLRYKSQKLADSYCVKVLKVDEESARVYVSCNAARVEMRPQIEKEINGRLERKDGPIRVKGKVMRVQRKGVDEDAADIGVWLDLCGVGIPGFVFIGNWAATFTPVLTGMVGYGDIVEVCVTGRVERKKGKEDIYYYDCSRKELGSNPWDSKYLEEQYHEGDIVRIKCLSLRKGYWFGQINGLTEIQVFAEYPSEARNFPIVPGMEYMGKIYHMDTKERSLKVRVFQALTAEKLTQKNQKGEETDAGNGE